MTVFRIAGAPITWGVCEAPGWGYQMSPERVLTEMAELGFAATEAGPVGFLSDDPATMRSQLDRAGLELAAGFVPAVLHEKGGAGAAAQRIQWLAEAGAEVAVLAASTGNEGYEQAGQLDDDGWKLFAANLDALQTVADGADITLTFHPHYGTLVESPEQIDRLTRTSDVALCLDTGHVMAGGGDPTEITRTHKTRIRHVHLKDVDKETAIRVREGELGYHQAVAAGMYRPIGEGDVDIAAVLTALDESDFEGWIVLEQDVVLGDEPPAGGGPWRAAGTSLRRLEKEIAGLGAVWSEEQETHKEEQ
ncbi:MAG: TIM barrel protein [Acidimicrobiia bacterium]